MAYLKWNAFVINDAVKYTAQQIKQLIKEFREEYPTNEGLAKRSDTSYLREWAVHALAYRWGIMKERSKDADMQFNIEPEVQFMYNILGPIALLLLKFYR